MDATLSLMMRAAAYDTAPPAPSVMVPLTTDRQIFREDGVAWRWKGVSAFQLLDHFAHGLDIDPFLAAYAGYNLLRVWTYTPVKDWGASAWEWPASEDVVEFLAYVGDRGWRVELTLLLDDDPSRIQQARDLLAFLAQYELPMLVVEIANEPSTHKDVDTGALMGACEASGFLYCSGDYEDSALWFGRYYVCHTARTHDWPRRAHDLLEFYNGDGPDKPTHPHHVPCCGDEPGKYQDVGTVLTEWRAYFGACALMGCGATFHSETGKLAQVPTETEKPLIATALEALNAFPPDAPYGPYRRIVEPGNEHGGPTETSRTYVVGPYMVRCQQQGTTAPEPGWIPIDADGVLWRR